MKRIAVLTSGGDSPGMNAAVRGVVRTGNALGYQMFGVRHGYAGLINGDLIPLGPRDVGGIVHLGGTVLGTSRCDHFRSLEGQRAGLAHLYDNEIESLIIIGGNGSQAGAFALFRQGFPTVGIASTIDNDLCGTDMCIGATTAIDIALEAVDRLRVTASAHERAFLVEVMGRHYGFLALMTAIAGGAEAVVIPEVETAPEDLIRQLQASHARGKSHAIVVVAEGARYNAEALNAYFAQQHLRPEYELRVTRLGHVQRGGHPGIYDRLLASRLGEAAVLQIHDSQTGVMVGLQGRSIEPTPLSHIAEARPALDPHLIDLAKSLAT